jgi:hypothetical protein
MVFGPVTACGLAHEWRREVSHWNGFVREHGRANTLLVRYEDLVTSPLERVNDVLRFIGAPELEALCEHTSTPLSRTLSNTQRSWHSSLGQRISTSKIGVYRSKFTAREIEIFEAIAGDELDAYGYSRDSPSPRGATLAERTYAAVADRCVRWVRKMRYASVVRLELQFRLRVLRRAFVSTLQRVS